MLNLAVVRSVTYYLDQVAPDPTAYYLGQGEAPGRWWGTLAAGLGLSGTVHADGLRLLLEGRHPADATPILRGRSASADGGGRGRRAGLSGPTVDVAVAADELGVSPRTVRRWAADGEALWRIAQESQPDRLLRSPDEVRARLVATLGAEAAQTADRCLLVPPAAGRRRRWEIPASEVDRLRSERRVPATRLGYDVVFRPAKGWSVLWAIGRPEVRRALAEVHRDAVADALSYLEATSALTRATVIWRGRPVRIRAKGAGLVVACFDHRESRAGDPLLHTHCLVANVTRLPRGRYGALEPSGLFRQQRAADAVYQATFCQLARRRLGIAPSPRPSAFPEPEGVPADVIRHFSKRTDEITEEVERHGSASAAARQLAALATRRAKQVAGRDEDLHSRWQREAAEVGFTGADVAGCLHRDVGRGLTPEQVHQVLARLAGPEGLTAAAATFTRGDVICALGAELGGAVAGPGLVSFADRFLASDAVVQVREHRPGRPRGRILEAGVVVDDLTAARFSVPELVAIEERLMAAAAEAGGPSLEPALVDTALAAHSHLSVEQTTMVKAVCTTTVLLRPVVGLPGSGKTTATRALVDSLHSAGTPVIGCAVTATAAAELGRESGLAACDTLARTLADLDAPGSLAPGTVVIADEASMLGHRHLDRLVNAVRAAGGAIVLIGDPHQHAAVGPGSFFSWLAGRRDEVPTLAANLRQLDVVNDDGRTLTSLAAEREASALYRDGRIVDSLAARDEAGLVTRAETPARLYDRLVADWWADGGPWADPMVASSNEARTRLNRVARQHLHDAGLLHGPVLAAGGKEFQAGDRVVARRNHRRLRSPIDPGWWVRNGAAGVVIAVDSAAGTATVDFSDRDGRTHQVVLPAGYVAAHLELGYALTDYGVQGRTLSRSRAVVDDAASAPGAYVATTRGRLENRIYVVEGETADSSGVDVGHAAPNRRRSGLDRLAARLDVRRPDPMLHQRDPYVADASRLAARYSPEELRRQATALDQLLAHEPADPTRALHSAETARAGLHARLQRLATAGKGPAALARHEQATSQLAKLEQSIAALRQRHTEWVHWHQHLLARTERRHALREALTALETKQRLEQEPVGEI